MAATYDRTSRPRHWLLTALALVPFATGWSWGSFPSGSGPRVFLFNLPIYAGDLILALAHVIAALVMAPVAAALWHHFVRRDGPILRLLPARR